MLTKVEDFKGLYYIPNATAVAPGSVGNKTQLVYDIELYENEVLDMLLGYELSTLLKLELNKKPFNTASSLTAATKWVELINGVDNYRGMREAIRAYVFYKWYQNDADQYTGTGTKKYNTQGTEIASMYPRAINAWRRFHDLTIGQSGSITLINKSIGSGVIYGEIDTVYKSLYSFLRYNDTYPEWVERIFENKNKYGI